MFRSELIEPVNRRRHARLAIDGDLQIPDTSLGVMMDVIDVSLGGFRTESPLPFLPGARHLFEFPAGDAAHVELEARVIHCYATPDRPGHYVLGWLWIDVPVNAAGVSQMMQHLTEVEAFASPTPSAQPH